MADGLRLKILGGGLLGAERAEEYARQLKNEVEQIPGLKANLVELPPSSPGAKGLGAPWAEVIIALGAAGALLPTIVETVKAWLLRQPPSMSIKLKDGDFEFEMNGGTSQDQVNDLLEKLLLRRSK